MGRIREIDKLKYGCSLCFTDIGAGPLVHFTNYSGMSRDDVEWTCEVCCCTYHYFAFLLHLDRPLSFSLVEHSSTGWRINHEEDLHGTSSRVAERQLFPIHQACWRILDACWNASTATTRLDLRILADFFVSQPRGWQLPHMLEGNWVSAGLKFTTGDYTNYRDPDDYDQLEKALGTLVFPDKCDLFERKTRSLLMYGRPDCFSLLPVELRLMILCLLPTKSVDTIRQVSGGMAFVPLEGTFWLSRLSEPQYSHLPKRMVQRSGPQKPGELPQWFLAAQDEKLQDRNRLRIIQHNQMLIDKMLQRQEYLKGMLDRSTVSRGRYVPLLECLDEPHPAYEKSEHTLTWRSEVMFDSLRPFTVVEAITPTYTSSYGGRYLTALVFGTASEDLVLGYCTSKAGHSINISDQSSQRNNVVMQSDSRGIFDVVTSKQTLQIMQLRKHGKIVLKPASLSIIAGLRAELTLVSESPFRQAGLTYRVQDNRIIKLGLIEPY